MPALPSIPPPEEWDFSKVSEEDVETCCRHEYGRERVGGPKAAILTSVVFGEALCAPYLTLPAHTRDFLNVGFPPNRQAIDFGTIAELLTLLSENLDVAELRILGEIILEKSTPPTVKDVDQAKRNRSPHRHRKTRPPTVIDADQAKRNRAFWTVLRRKLKPPSEDEYNLKLFLRVDPTITSPTELKNRFGELLLSVLENSRKRSRDREKESGLFVKILTPIFAKCGIPLDHSRSSQPRGKKRGPNTTRFRQSLANLAIMRIRHSLPLTKAIEIYQSSYLAKEFCDRDGSDFFDSKEDVIKRVDERRSSAIESFRKLNPDLGPDAKPLSSGFFSGIS